MVRGRVAAGGHGDLPYAEERYGSRAFQRQYTCDHKGVRLVRRRGRAGAWGSVQKFLKVLYGSASDSAASPESVAFINTNLRHRERSISTSY